MDAVIGNRTDVVAPIASKDERKPIDPRWLNSGAGVRLYVNGVASDRFEAFCDNAGRIILHGLRGEFVITRAVISDTRARFNDRMYFELE